ncbi:MAG: FecR family protein [bacterium]|nr:FecR family protein [bacterium]
MNKKLTIAIVVAVLIIIALIGYFSLSKDPEIAVLNETAAAEPITITSLEPDVFLKHKEQIDQIKVESSATTTIGSTVTTGINGRALIEADQNKTILNFNTVAVLEPQNNNSSQLSGGALWARVQKVVNKGEFHQIQTQNAVAVVRGTAFGLWYEGDTTRLWVTEGIVSFFKKDPVTGVIDEASEIKVVPGQKASRKGTGELVLGELNEKDIKDPWFVYNNPAYELPSEPAVVPKTPSTGSPQAGTGQATPKPATVTPTPTPAAPTNTDYSVTIKSYTPREIEEGNRPRIRMTGTSFNHVDSIYIGPYDLSLNIASDILLDATPPLMADGVYDIIIIDDKSRKTVMRNAFKVIPDPTQQPEPTPESPNTYPGFSSPNVQ